MAIPHNPLAAAIARTLDHTTPQPLLVTPAETLYRLEFLAQPLPEKPEAAARLRLARGTFPVATVMVGGRRMVRVTDIQAYIEGLAVDHAGAPPARGPVRGRRRNPKKRDPVQRTGAQP